MKGIFFSILSLLLTLTILSCGRGTTASPDAENLDALRQKLAGYAAKIPAKTGIAVITPEKDTVTVNNDAHYTLMSVFKLHQALAICDHFDKAGISLDSVVKLRRESLDSTTWSPMLKDHRGEVLTLPTAELLRYTLQESDNNASNYLFENILSVSRTDSTIRDATGISDFKLSYTEAEMKQSPDPLSADNWSTPLACAMLIDKVYNDSLVSTRKQAFIKETLMGCITGDDRLASIAKEAPDVKIGHKTGSGYRNEKGLLMAHNDVGHILLPDGRAYSIAVLIKDFDGSEAEASDAIAHISSLVYRFLTGE